jgi:cyclomaltodextrinase
MARDTPAWIRSAALYQVYLRNFTREGTFSAAVPRLKAIRELGFDLVCLTPIHPVGMANRKGEWGSPYAIADHRAVDPGLGGIEDLRRFLAEAHGLGLKVLMDVVFNHSACDSVLLGTHSEWYLHDAKGRPTRKVADWSDVYDFDFAHRELREYLLETLAFWAETGFDGFRCDVASLVPLDFWIEARSRLNAERPLLWLAESVETGFVKYLRGAGWNAASDPELHEAFDLTYDYDGFGYLKAYFSGSIGLDAYLRHLLVQETLYPSHAVKARFLENHDQPRAASVLRGSDRLMNWTVFSQLLPGLIFVYMGQEYAMTGRPDLFAKDPVPWDQGSDEFLAFFRRLLPICRRVKSDHDAFELVELSAGVLALRWRRPSQNRRCTAIVNLEDRFGECTLPFPLKGRDLLGETDSPSIGVKNGAKMTIPKRPLIVQET